MKRTKILVLTLFAALAVSAVASAVASAATEGPFYKIEGARLKKGETKAIEGGIAKEYVLKVTGIEIKCTGQKLENATLVGSSGSNGALSVETIVFEGCTVTGNGEKCGVTGKKITTAPVENMLDFEKATSAKPETLLVLFTPVETSVFVTVGFTPETGGTCTVPNTAVEGSVGAEAWSGGVAVKWEEEPAKAEIGEVNFPATSITEEQLEVKKKRFEYTTGLKAFGKTATLVGRSTVKLVSKEKWCVSANAGASKCL